MDFVRYGQVCAALLAVALVGAGCALLPLNIHEEIGLGRATLDGQPLAVEGAPVPMAEGMAPVPGYRAEAAGIALAFAFRSHDALLHVENRSAEAVHVLAARSYIVTAEGKELPLATRVLSGSSTDDPMRFLPGDTRLLRLFPLGEALGFVQSAFFPITGFDETRARADARREVGKRIRFVILLEKEGGAHTLELEAVLDAVSVEGDRITSSTTP